MTENPSPEQDSSKPKATRNILLIRHSQYNLSGINDKERILTPLGHLSLHQIPCAPRGYELVVFAGFRLPLCLQFQVVSRLS